MFYGSDPLTHKASILISWATCDGVWTPAPTGTALPTDAATSVVRLGRAPGVYTRTVQGVATSYVASFGSTGGGTYVCPILHHALVTQLESGKWFYKIEDGVQLAGVPAGSTPAYGSFDVRDPSNPFPYTISFLGDPGQLVNTTTTIEIAAAAKPDLVLMTGDLSYADQIIQNPKYGPAGVDLLSFYQHYGQNMNFFGPRWDMWGRFVSRLIGSVPYITTNGNHEAPDDTVPLNFNYFAQNAASPCAGFACAFNFEARQLNYNHRYPLLQTEAIRTQGPTTDSLGPVTLDPATYTRNAWQRTEVAGVATIITLNEYILYDDASTASAQYQWLANELATRPVDRSRTPWLLVMLHAPWYASFAKHWMEAECFRKTYEPLFAAAGVDLIASGHQHSYERTYPSNNWAVDAECGATHVMVGGGGSDDLTMGYIDQVLGTNSPYGYYKATYCLGANTPNPVQPYWPAYFATQYPGQYGPGGWCTPPPEILCPAAQPAVSAFRAQSYGTGVFKMLSPTKAVWTWTAHADPHKPADEVVLLRSDARQALCATRAAKQGVLKNVTAWNPLTKVTTVKTTINSTLNSLSATGLGAKPVVDPSALPPAAAAAKADALWQANWKSAGVVAAKAKVVAKLNVSVAALG